MLVTVPLSAQQEAHVALILEVYASARADIERLAQQALNLRNQRLDPLRTELGVPNGVTFSVQARVNGDPAYLMYESLLSPRDPPAPDALSRSVESTSADAPES